MARSQCSPSHRVLPLFFAFVSRRKLRTFSPPFVLIRTDTHEHRKSKYSNACEILVKRIYRIKININLVRRTKNRLSRPPRCGDSHV